MVASRLFTALPPTRFVGRREELGRIKRAFASGQRLVTVWGMAGIGKTRLALEFASDVAHRPSALRVFFCEAADARDSVGFCSALARGLDTPLARGLAAADGLVDGLGDVIRARGECLLVIDNVEQVIDAAAAVIARLVAVAPKARVLVTSRERLRVAAEVTEELAPLSLPAAGRGIAGSEAVELFVDRATAQAPQFRFETGNEELVAELCARLEGIPLAIEIAVGRLETLGLSGLLERFGALRLDVLTGGRRDGAARQATLRAAIAWSWDLLDPPERATLAQCAVFRGGFSPEAAERVLEVGAPVLDVLRSLRDKSLLRSFELAPGEVRLGLFENVREFAEERLGELGLADEAGTRHAAYYLETGAAWAAPERGADGLRSLTLELPNLLAIVERPLGADPSLSERAAIALEALLIADPVFAAQGPVARQIELLDAALDAADRAGAPDPHLRARALQARGRAHGLSGRVTDAVRDLEAALAAATELGADALSGTVEIDIGIVYHQARSIDAAERRYERALKLLRGAGDRRSEGRVLGNLGALHHDVGQFDRALACYGEALAVVREVGDRRLEGVFRSNRGVLLHEQGHAPEAREELDRALAILDEVGDRRLVAITLGNRGTLDHDDGRHEAARAAHERALALLRDIGEPRSEGLCLGRLGAVLASEGQIEHAAACFDDAETLLARVGDAVALEAIGVSRGLLDLARATLARAAGDATEAARHMKRARSRILSASAPGPAERAAPAETSDDVRAAVRILERALARMETGHGEGIALPEDVLLVGPDAGWIRAPHNAWQDLRKRRPLRLLVSFLVDHRERAPGRAVALDALREAGWPGESMSQETAVNRIHVAFAELRKRGLKPLLLKIDEGYLFDPAIAVRRVAAALCPR